MHATTTLQSLIDDRNIVSSTTTTMQIGPQASGDFVEMPKLSDVSIRKHGENHALPRRCMGGLGRAANHCG